MFHLKEVELYGLMIDRCNAVAPCTHRGLLFFVTLKGCVMLWMCSSTAWGLPKPSGFSRRLDCVLYHITEH